MNVSEYQTAKQLRKEGKLAEAITAYEKAIELNPSFYSYHHELGEVLAEKGDWEGAIASYSKAIELNPLSLGSYNNLGKLLFEQGKLGQAAKFYQGGIDIIESEYYGFYKGLGDICALQEKWDKAAPYYEKAMELNQNDEEIYSRFGEILERQGRLKKAIAVYQQGVENFPENAQMASHLKAIEGKQTLSETYYNLADILGKQGHVEEAIKAYHSSIDLNPELLDCEDSRENVVISTSDLTDRVNHLDKIYSLRNRTYLIEMYRENTNYIEPPRTIHEEMHNKFFTFPSTTEKPAILAVIPEGRCVLYKKKQIINQFLAKIIFFSKNLVLAALTRRGFRRNFSLYYR